MGFQSASASIPPADFAPKRFKVQSANRPPHTVTPSGAGAAGSEKSVSKAGCVMIVKAAAAGIEMETPLPLPSSESTRPSRREPEWRGRLTDFIFLVFMMFVCGTNKSPP